jgi:secondary thiamine-phosphate synthase enzyme
MVLAAPSSVRRHTRIPVASRRPTDLLDLTDRLTSLVAESGVSTGLLNVQTLHTTTGIVINEAEPMLLVDFQTHLEWLAPGDGRYRHDDATLRPELRASPDRPNGHAHCRALLLPSSVCLNIVDGRPVLGRWQRIIFIELDGPQEREVSALVVGEAGQ